MNRQVLVFISPIATGFYVYSLSGLILIAGALGLYMWSTAIGPTPETGVKDISRIIALQGGMLFMGFTASIISLVFIGQIWSAISQGKPRMSPGSAIGFLFIPLFNIIWHFIVFWGWAKDYNKFASNLHKKAPRVSEGIPLAACALFWVGVIVSNLQIPFLSDVILLTAGVFYIWFVNQACDAINWLSNLSLIRSRK